MEAVGLPDLDLLLENSESVSGSSGSEARPLQVLSTAQMALIAQARQAPITSYGTAANLLNARGQRYQDILAKALGGYQTAAEQANIAAENAWRLYQDALQQDQFNAQLRASRGGGGGNGLNLLDLNGNGIPDIYE